MNIDETLERSDLTDSFSKIEIELNLQLELELGWQKLEHWTFTKLIRFPMLASKLTRPIMI